MHASVEDENYERYSRDDIVMHGLLKIIKSINSREEQRDCLSKKKEVSEGSSSSHTDQSDEEHESPLGIPERKKHTTQRYASHEQKHVQKVHEELCDINKKLQRESKRLRNWDLELQKRESHLDEIETELSTYATSMKDTIEKEISKRCGEFEKEYNLKMQLLQEENKKSRNSFKIIKKANDTLKAKVAEDEVKLKNNEEKQSSLQSRISNLQRKIELLNKQINEQAIEYKNAMMMEKVKSVSKISKEQVSSPSIFYEPFTSLLQWIADVHLKQNVDSMINGGHQLHTEDDDVNIQLTNDRALKIIIFMPNVLRHASSMNEKFQLSFVQFLYWAMLHLHITQCTHRLSHSATYRRIGEELFQANIPKQSKENSVTKAFFRSLNYNIRILSSLIILQSINQADILVQVFHALNDELKHELSKEFFLDNHGTEMLLPLFKLTNKIHVGYATDILMILVVDSPYMQQFLNELSTVEWIQSIITILKASSDDITLMENLSLILQRLSKAKGVKPIFDALHIKSTITELLRLSSCEGEYLQLNLRSILLNIESMKTHKEK